MNRQGLFCIVMAVAVVLVPAVAHAQGGGSGFGIGPRLTFVRGDADLPEGSARFSGGAIRLGGGKTAFEIAMDFRSGVTGNLTERIKDYPIQGSLLIFPVRGRIAPYLLGGVGWYSQRVQRLGPSLSLLEDKTTRTMGYHGGVGGEVRVHQRIGLYGDYRYTHIRFGDQKPASLPRGAADQRPAGSPVLPSWIPYADRLKMSHQGSQFTWGATFYF